jgi:hypothetical protein
VKLDSQFHPWRSSRMSKVILPHLHMPSRLVQGKLHFNFKPSGVDIQDAKISGIVRKVVVVVRQKENTCKYTLTQVKALLI